MGGKLVKPATKCESSSVSNKMDFSHVLEVPVVVQHLFKLMIAATLSFTDFKNFRLVCRAWYEESLTHWRKTAVLTLQDAPLFSPSKCPGINPIGFLNELDNPQSFHSLTTKPYKKYKVIDLRIHLEHVCQNQDASRFWSLVGPSIKTLILDKVTFEIDDKKNDKLLTFRDTLLQFLRGKMPILESLTMTNISWNKDLFGNSAQNPKPAGLSTLKSLTLDNSTAKCFYFTDFPNLTNLKGVQNLGLKFLFHFSHDNLSNSSVKRLDMIDNFDHTFNFSTEESMRFTILEHFGVAVASSHEENLLRAFLQNHANTLKSVHLFHFNLKSRMNNRSPFTVEMKELTQVILWGNVVRDLTFLVHLPNLQLLHVDVLAFTKRKQVQITQVDAVPVTKHELETDLIAEPLQNDLMRALVLPKLTHLFLSCRLSRKSVEALGEWMPNLKTLKAILNCATLPAVVQQWKNLEQLHCLWGSQFLDCDLQSLIELKNLWSFAYDAECGGSALTDASVKLFLVCPQITHLKLCVSNQFSLEAELLLREKFQHVQIHKNSRDNSMHKDWECCEFERYKNLLTFYSRDSSLSSLDSDASDASDDSDDHFVFAPPPSPFEERAGMGFFL